MTDDHSITNLNNAAADFHRAHRDLNRVAVLNELRAAGDTGATSTELADRIGLSNTTARRQLEALLDEGLIQRSTGGRVRLSADFDHDSADSTGITDEEPEPPTPDATPETDVDADADVDVEENASRPGDRPEWPRWTNTALNQFDAGARRVVRFVNADPEGAVRLVGATIGAVIIGLLALTVLADLMEWAVNGNPLQDLTGVLPARELVTDPLQQWFTTHTAGTGIDVETAAWTWGITGAVVWVFACCNQLGAQLVAWPAYGVATAAIVWFGTTTAAHRPVAAGLVAIVWFVLSLFALNRRPRLRTRRVYIAPPAGKKEAAV